MAGHFGELLQGRLGDEVVLITLPCPALSVEAHWDPGGGSLEIDQPDDLLSSRIVSRLFELAKVPMRGRLHLRAEMPLGGGAGASTAAILALAKVLGHSGGPEAAALCLDLEGATDPLMLPKPGQVLWSSRAGRVIETLPEVPAFDVVGGFHGPAVRTDPDDRAFAEVTDLIADWNLALGDRTRLAAIATESARRNQTLRGGPSLTPLLDVARAHGALGIAAAHTGSARAVLFAPGDGDHVAAQAALRAAGLTGVIRFRSPGPA